MRFFRFPFKRSIQLLSILPLFTMAACEGYEIRPYDKTPYGDRTAGHGVEYVLAKMAPEKGPVVEAPPVETPPPVVEAQPEPARVLTPEPEIHDAAPVFNKIQKK